MADNIKDFATSLVATPPSPSTTGTTLTLSKNHGARMPTPPFKATVHPSSEMPTLDNAEKVLVTAVNGDTLTIVRGQGNTTAKNISAGWRFSNALFAEDIPTRDSLGLGTTNTVNFANLSGNNTGDQDLSSYATKNGTIPSGGWIAYTSPIPWAGGLEAPFSSFAFNNLSPNFGVGFKVKLTQNGTVKYFSIRSVSTSSTYTIYIVIGLSGELIDYDNPITDFYYSPILTPSGVTNGVDTPNLLDGCVSSDKVNWATLSSNLFAVFTERFSYTTSGQSYTLASHTGYSLVCIIGTSTVGWVGNVYPVDKRYATTAYFATTSGTGNLDVYSLWIKSAN